MAEEEPDQQLDMQPIIKGAVIPAFGSGPFADRTEVSGPPTVVTVPDVYRRFFATDARSVMVTLRPNHLNFIKNPSCRVDATGWDITTPTSVLSQAAWHVDAGQVRADGLALKAVKGSDGVFGTTTAKPTVLPWSGQSYTWMPQDTASSNTLNLASATYSATDYIEIDVDLSGTADATYPIYSTATANGSFFIYINGTSIIYRIKWSAANQDSTWTTTRQSGRHTYRFVRTTTTVELFVDDVSKGVKTLTQAVPATNAQDVQIGLTATAGSAERSKYYRVAIGAVSQMIPANVSADLSTIANTGTAGGNWTISRAATGNKVVVVNRPLVLFQGGQYMDTALAQQTTGTLIMIVREYADTSSSILGSGSATGPPTTGGFYNMINVSSLNQYSYIYGTGGAQVSSTKALPAHGHHVIAVANDATTFKHWVDGALIASKATAASGVLIKDRIRVGHSTYGSFVLLSASMFDRVLTDAEVAQVGTEMTSWAPPTLDPDSWVGQSLVVNGDAVVRYRDSGYYIYVGITDALPDSQGGADYMPAVRESPSWTFSAYVKGTGRARLVMEAYQPTQVGVVNSPPANQNLTTVADPSTANYGNATVKDGNGVVWTRDSPPFYTMLDIVTTSAVSPDTITTKGLMAPAVVDGRNSMWELKTSWPSTAPYYTEWGVPQQKAAPFEEPSGAKYIQDAQGIIYQLISPAPGAAPYYRAITPPYSDKPEYLIPDLTLFPEYYRYTTNLWRIKSPMPSAPPYYQIAGAITTAAGNPATDPPGAQYVEYTRTLATGVTVKEIWSLNPKPYYTSSDGQIYFGRVAGDWITITDAYWQRLTISTSAKWAQGVSFAGAAWIDARVETDDASGMKISSLMLDPDEEVVAEYFDGAMTESEEVDDYLWEDAAAPNNCISWYYYDRRARARWLYENLPRLVPANRPVQIFFNDYKHPYTAGSAAGIQSQSTLMRPRIGL